MELISSPLFEDPKMRVANPIAVDSIKDLLKFVMGAANLPYGNSNGEIFYTKHNGSSFYYVLVKAENVYNFRGIIFLYYVQASIPPKDWLWWNVKTGDVQSHESPQPEQPEIKDSTQVFPIIHVTKLPDWFVAWPENQQ